jgi:hypothetical protein
VGSLALAAALHFGGGDDRDPDSDIEAPAADSAQRDTCTSKEHAAAPSSYKLVTAEGRSKGGNLRRYLVVAWMPREQQALWSVRCSIPELGGGPY